MFRRVVLLTILWVCSLASAGYAQSWSLLAPSGTLPSPRELATSFYSPVSNRLVVFGGYPQVTAFTNDLWILSNANGLGAPSWTRAIPPNAAGSPPARGGAAMVYDAANNRAILAGGLSVGGAPLNDVWILTNADATTGIPTWQRLTPTGVFPGKQEFTAAYDRDSNRLIVTVGVGGQGTWVLTNANGLGGTPAWVKLTTVGDPPGRYTWHMEPMYDDVHNRLILFGGYSQALGTDLNDVWVLANADGQDDSATWVQLQPTGPLPPPRTGGVTFYDAATNRLLVFSGQVQATGVYMNDLWILEGANGLGDPPRWTPVSAGGVPIAPRFRSSAAFDSARNRLIVFGGAGDGLVRNETWVLADANGAPSETLGIDSVYPDHGGQGPVTIHVTGGGYQLGASVSLVGIGGAISATTVALNSASTLEATFDLTDAAPGPRTVIVTNPDGREVMTPAAFLVEASGQADIWVDTVGRDRIRSGGEQTYYIVIGNRGNVDSGPVSAWLSFPQQIGWVSHPGDTVTGTDSTNGNTLLAIDVISVDAGGVVAVPIRLQAPVGASPFQLRTWTNAK